MKFTLGWLRDHLETDATLDRITDTLTRIGLELEAVNDPGAALAPFRTARIIEAVQHPNADRLRVCSVDAGEGVVQVVCGAPNARSGLHVIFAPPGTYIPGSAITIKTGEIRGVQSGGMLCSLRELGLDGDGEGIAELPDGTAPGQFYADFAQLRDPVIDIGVTPNRGDCFAVRGVARDLAAAGLGTLKPFAPAPIAGEGDSAIRWDNRAPDACTWILGRTVRGVRNGPSPAWLQARLRAIGLRPIDALVDITNYFCVGLGRPLHVFDVAKLAGDTLILRPGAGESFRALNGRDVTVTQADCVIADANSVQSLAGIVGGESSGSTDATQDVFLECALFDAVRIAQSGRAHGIVSDARQRFERGIDAAALPAMLDAATQMVLDLCGGTPSRVVEAGAEPAWQRTATLRFARLETLGGLAVPANDAVARLERLGCTVQAQDDAQVTVAVPPWRNDIAPAGTLALAPELPGERHAALEDAARQIEAECDLIEEVLRLGGLDAVPAVSLPVPAVVPAATATPGQSRAALARRTLADAGLLECVTFSFTDQKKAALFGGAPDALRLLNPIAADLDQMRPSALAPLADAAARNAARGLPDAGLFEIGPVFTAAGQSLTASGLRTGHTPRSAADPARPVDALDAKADALAVLLALGVSPDALSVSTDAPDYFHPGQSGCLRQGPKLVLARFGALHPSVAAAMGLDGPAVAFEVLLDAIPEPKRRKKAAPVLSALQPVRRDFAFLADNSVQAEAVLRAARGADRTLIVGVTLFDVYQGDKLPDGQKSLAVEVTFQPTDRTLTDAELEAASAKVAEAVKKATGAILRG